MRSSTNVGVSLGVITFGVGVLAGGTTAGLTVLLGTAGTALWLHSGEALTGGLFILYFAIPVGMIIGAAFGTVVTAAVVPYTVCARRTRPVAFVARGIVRVCMASVGAVIAAATLYAAIAGGRNAVLPTASFFVIFALPSGYVAARVVAASYRSSEASAARERMAGRVLA